MSNDRFHLHPDLHDASLDKACKMADRLVEYYDPDITFDLSYMLEFLRLNFDLVPKK